jgi:hypothetical protein
MPPLAAGTGLHRGDDTFRDRQRAFSALVAEDEAIRVARCGTATVLGLTN